MRALAVFLLTVVLLSACSVQNRPARTLETTLPTSGISALALDVNIGDVSVTPSPDNKVHVSIGLRPSNSFLGLFRFVGIELNMGGNRAIKAAVLSQSSDHGVLKLYVRYPGHTGGVEEDWRVQIPAHMQVSSDINVGKLQVTGIAGGIDARLNVGKVALNVPRGPMRVSVNVGKIQALAHTLNYGHVVVGADVGDYTLKVDGTTVGNQGKAGPGDHRLSYQGHGQDTISLTVSTGKVALALSKQ